MLAATSSVGWALHVVGLTVLLNAYLAWRVVVARQQYDVPYPHMYAPDKHPYKRQFDSVQRAHQNTLEGLPGVQLTILAVSAGPYGHLAAPLGVLYIAGRLVYAAEYERLGPEGRHTGALLAHAGDLPLLALTFATARALTAA